MSVQDQINRITNEVASQKDIITQIKSLLETKILGSGGNGSGIIDVTELPTENIDENAIYRVTGSFVARKPRILYIAENNFISLTGMILSGGAPQPPNYYLVDELSDLILTDLNMGVVHIYILKDTGIAYVNLSDIGIITLGLALFGQEGFDKGKLDLALMLQGTGGITDGIYTTFYVEDKARFFIRENNNWKELTSSVTSAGDLINELTFELDEDYFKLSDGSYATIINMTKFMYNPFLSYVNIPGSVQFILPAAFMNCESLGCIILNEGLREIYPAAFAGTAIQKIVIPSTVEYIGSGVFSDCGGLRTVTFRGTPTELEDCFSGCEIYDINVPWSEGEVAGAPWGAIKSTINYNYTGE